MKKSSILHHSTFCGSIALRFIFKKRISNIEQKISNYEVVFLFLCAVFIHVINIEINSSFSFKIESSFVTGLNSYALTIIFNQIFDSLNSFKQIISS